MTVWMIGEREKIINATSANEMGEKHINEKLGRNNKQPPKRRVGLEGEKLNDGFYKVAFQEVKRVGLTELYRNKKN